MPQKTELESTALLPMNDQDQLRFIVKFANTDIDELKKTPDDPAGIPTLLYELRRYLEFNLLGRGEPGIFEALKQHPDDIKETIADVKRMLEAVAEHRWNDTVALFTHPQMLRLVVDSKNRLAMNYTVRFETKNRRITPDCKCELREQIIDIMLDDLRGTKVELLRVGKCKRLGCTRLFYKVKTNQDYCDHRCANLAAASRRRQKPEAKPHK